MRVRIELNEAQTEEATGVLMDAGFEADVDFTTIYGSQWRVVGLYVDRRHSEVFRVLKEETDLFDEEER